MTTLLAVDDVDEWGRLARAQRVRLVSRELGPREDALDLHTTKRVQGECMASAHEVRSERANSECNRESIVSTQQQRVPPQALLMACAVGAPLARLHMARCAGVTDRGLAVLGR